LSAVGDGDWFGSLAGLTAERLNLLDDVHALDDGAEHDVLVVQPARLDRADEELRAVGVGSGVGHGQSTWSLMLEGEVLILELLAVNRLAASAVVVGEVAALAHEVGNDSMERRTLEAETLIAGAQGAEVLRRLRSHVRTQFHHDAANGLSVDCHIEVDSR